MYYKYDTNIGLTNRLTDWLKGLPHDGEFEIAVSRKTGSSSKLNKIENCAHMTRTDWFHHFHSPWESEGYKAEIQNDQLRLI